MSGLSENDRRKVTLVSAEITGGRIRGVQQTASGIGQVYIAGSHPIAAGIGAGLGLVVVALIAAATAPSKEELEAARKGLTEGFDSANVDAILRSNLAKDREDAKIPRIEVAAPGTAPTAGASTTQAHTLKLDYIIGVRATGPLQRDVFPTILVVGKLIAPDGKTVMRSNTWVFCGVDAQLQAAAANGGAFLRSELERGATALAEAIPYDLFVSTDTRTGWTGGGPLQGCMDFDNLPSGIGKRPDRPARISTAKPASSDPAENLPGSGQPR